MRTFSRFRITLAFLLGLRLTKPGHLAAVSLRGPIKGLDLPTEQVSLSLGSPADLSTVPR